MIARWCLLAALATAGCDTAVIDPCEGKAGACVGVHLDSDVTPLDQIRITLDRRADAVQLTPAAPATLSLPVRFAIELPAGTTSAHLAFVGLAGGAERAGAELDVAIPPSGHALVPVRLTGATLGDAGAGDGDSDGAAEDLSAVDAEPPDLFGTLPLTINYTGTGTGQVTVNGATCAKPGCVMHFFPGTIISLLAAADAPVSVFNVWSGACSGIVGTCAITLTAAATVSADFRRAYRNLTVTPVLLAGGTGTVTPSPAGVSCGTNCWSYPMTQTVMLGETPGGASTFAGWGATGCGRGSSCSILMSTDTAVLPTFTGAPVNYVFVTSTTYSVSQVAGGADALCQARASAAALPNSTNYKAWLAIGGATASSKLGTARGWVRMDGLPFADSVASLTGGAVLYPIALNDTNGAATGQPWTGANGDGTLANNCTEFVLTVGNATGGVPTGSARAWSSGSSPACSGNQPLLCFGTHETTAISLPATPGARIGFVSQGGFTPNGAAMPTDAAKTICHDEALLASLPGTYQPFLATVGSGGLAGLNTQSAGPWARLDGVLLSGLAPQLDFGGAGTKMLAALDQRANGTRVAILGSAWTGVNSTTCADWSDNQNSDTGGITSYTQVAGTSTSPCDQSLPVFCLQE